MSPAPGPNDDGCVPIELLRSRGARRIPVEEINAAFSQSARTVGGSAGVHDGSDLHAHELAVCNADLDEGVPRAPLAEGDDEDPFLFRDLGFNDAQAVHEPVPEVAPCEQIGTDQQPRQNDRAPFALAAALRPRGVAPALRRARSLQAG